MLAYYALARVEASVYTVLLQVHISPNHLAAIQFIIPFILNCEVENSDNCSIFCNLFGTRSLQQQVASPAAIGRRMYTCRFSNIQSFASSYL